MLFESCLRKAAADKQPIIDGRDNKGHFLIVPDVHARVDFVKKVFETYSPKGWTIIFLGDIFHAEGAKANRWFAADVAYENMNNLKLTEIMESEVLESFNSLHMILENQLEFPDKVHVLRGNHDDTKCAQFSDYGKYCKNFESRIFRKSIELKFGKKFLENYLYPYEEVIPYLYLGPNFLASHTVPSLIFQKHNVKFNDLNTFEQFCWTDNVWGVDIKKKTFNQNVEYLNYGANWWFIEHRPVTHPTDLVREQLEGKLVQINHPNKWVVLEVENDQWKAVRLDVE